MRPDGGLTAFFVEASFETAFQAPSVLDEVAFSRTLPYKWEDAAAKYASTKPK